MPTKEIGPTKIAWPHMWLRSAMVGKAEPSKGIRPPTKTVSIAANAKTPSHESSSRAARAIRSHTPTAIPPMADRSLAARLAFGT